jgi:hypothetical protein
VRERGQRLLIDGASQDGTIEAVGLEALTRSPSVARPARAAGTSRCARRAIMRQATHRRDCIVESTALTGKSLHSAVA